MTPHQWQKVKEVFLAALGQPPDKRAQFVRERCGGSVEVVDEAMAMLAEHRDAQTSAGDTITASDGNSAALFDSGGSLPAGVAELAEHLPHLEIQSQLGQGGMGVVYRARQRALDRTVALKVLPAEAGRNPAFAERFSREARALARLNHPNIVAIYEFGQAGGRYYLTMEYVDGINLRQMEKNERLSPRQALAIVPQICDALQYAHDQGIVHRDIKPENILLDRQGRVKIADFGLAKLRATVPTDPALTQAEQVMGTPHYMAPEQIERPLSVDHRADIYSLGVVFYEMLTGELPMGRFAPPSQKAAVDARVDAVVLRSLEKEPQRRYQAVSEVHSDLQTICQDGDVADYSGGPTLAGSGTVRRMARWTAEAAILAATVALLVPLWTGLRDWWPLGEWSPWLAWLALIPPVNFFNGLEPVISTASGLYYGALLVSGLALLARAMRGSRRTRFSLVPAVALLATVVLAPAYRLIANPLVARRPDACTGYVQYDSGNRLLAGRGNGEIDVCDRLGRPTAGHLNSKLMGAANIRASAGGRLLVCRENNVLELIDTARGQSVATINNPANRGIFGAFSPDGAKFAVVAFAGDNTDARQWRRDRDLGLRIFAAADGALITREQTPLLRVTRQAVDWSGDFIAVSECYEAGRRGVLLYDIRQHKVKFILVHPEYREGAMSVKLSPDARILAVGFGPVGLWDTNSGKLLRTLRGDNNGAIFGWAVCLDFSPDGKLLACGEGNSAVHLWDVATGKQLRHFGMGSQFASWYTHSVSFDRTGRLLACGGDRGDIVIWRVP